MSARNSLVNKAKRRAEREDHAFRVERKRVLQKRLEYLAYAPPDTFENLEEEVEKAIEEANEGI